MQRVRPRGQRFAEHPVATDALDAHAATGKLTNPGDCCHLHETAIKPPPSRPILVTAGNLKSSRLPNMSQMNTSVHQSGRFRLFPALGQRLWSMAANFPSSPLACGSLAHVEVNRSPCWPQVLVAAARVSWLR
jgi:hypothetical protein